MQKNPCIGIVGGLSPESTLLYYRYMIDEYISLRNDENYPEIVIYSVSFGKFISLMKQRKYNDAADYLISALKGLQSLGCGLTLIAANTPHILYDELIEAVKVPILNIIDVLAESLKKDNIEKVGILGTYTTMTSDFYIARLRRHGIEALAPSGKDAELIDGIIMNELVKGVVNESSKRLIGGIAEKLIERGAEAIALSCTELPLLFKEWIGKVKVYNTAELHAKKAVRIALGLEEFPKLSGK